MQVQFTVPGLIPPTQNHYLVKTIRARRDGTAYIAARPTAETIAFKNAVAIFCCGLTVAPESVFERKRVKYRVEIDVFYGKGHRGDADNRTKIALDALQDCGCIHNDNNVVSCEVRVHKDQRENPRTEYKVERMMA